MSKKSSSPCVAGDGQPVLVLYSHDMSSLTNSMRCKSGLRYSLPAVMPIVASVVTSAIFFYDESFDEKLLIRRNARCLVCVGIH